MQLKKKIAIAATALSFSACMSAEHHRYQNAQYMRRDAPLNICLHDAGIDPDAFISCWASLPVNEHGRVCAGDPEKQSAAYRCVVQEASRQQHRPTTCLDLGDVTSCDI